MQEANQQNRLASMFGRSAYLIAALCAACALGGIMILMLIDVTGRYLFNSPVPGAAEIIELAMGVMVFAALPLVTARNEHVRLDYFDHALPALLRPWLAVLVELISAATLGLIGWRLFDKAATVIRYGDSTPFLKIPVAPIALFLAATTAIAAAIFVMQAYQQVREVWLDRRRTHAETDKNDKRETQ